MNWFFILFIIIIYISFGRLLKEGMGNDFRKHLKTPHNHLHIQKCFIKESQPTDDSVPGWTNWIKKSFSQCIDSTKENCDKQLNCKWKELKYPTEIKDKQFPIYLLNNITIEENPQLFIDILMKIPKNKIRDGVIEIFSHMRRFMITPDGIIWKSQVADAGGNFFDLIISYVIWERERKKNNSEVGDFPAIKINMLADITKKLSKEFHVTFKKTIIFINRNDIEGAIRAAIEESKNVQNLDTIFESFDYATCYPYVNNKDEVESWVAVSMINKNYCFKRSGKLVDMKTGKCLTKKTEDDCKLAIQNEQTYSHKHDVLGEIV